MFDFFAFLTYAFLMAVTPGPNTLMTLGNSTRFGFRRTLPFCLGILTGMCAILLTTLALGSALFHVIPAVKSYMTVLGAAYILYIAYKMLKSSAVQLQDSRPLGFKDGLLLQLVNAKAWLYCLTTLSVYILPHFSALGDRLFYAGIMAVLCVISLLIWSTCGTVFCKVLEKHHKIVNIVLAALLVYCAVALF